MNDVIYWAKSSEVQSAVDAFTSNYESNSLMILERLPVSWLDEETLRTGLQFAKFNSAEAFDQWERGRIFNPKAELRWERIDNYFHVVYVGSDRVTLPEIFQRDTTLNLAEAETKERYYYLWGKKLDSKGLKAINRSETEQLFLELPVGRVLQYPVNNQANRVQLKLLEYVDPTTKQQLYHRYQGVETA